MNDSEIFEHDGHTFKVTFHNDEDHENRGMRKIGMGRLGRDSRQAAGGDGP